MPDAVDTSSRIVNDGLRLGAHLRTTLDERAAPPLAVIPQRDGRTTLFSGDINDGTADALEAALCKAPNATAVVLRSEGSWLREGTLVADVIRRHHLCTYVEQTYASACTIAFLADEDRAAASGARLDFRRPRAVGAERDQSPGVTDSELRRVYLNAGLPDTFVRRVQDTPFGQIWFPTTQELLADYIITRTSPDGEYATMATQLDTCEALAVKLYGAPLYAASERRYPTRFSRLIGTLWPELQHGMIDV